MTLLDHIIRHHITAEGQSALPVDKFMQLCLYHPQHGYYMQEQIFGKDGDFITAPELTPLFGQTLAIWVVKQWEKMGSPTPFSLVEGGPGRGVLMADLLSALKRISPTCYAAAQVALLEISPRLRGEQAMMLQAHPHVTWAENLGECNFALPTLFIGNELLDAFPIKQFQEDRERLVDIVKDQFVFTTSEYSITETSPAQDAFMAELKQKMTHGIGLFIDYGKEDAAGDTLQALHKHEKVSVFHKVGESDLTAHVNFSHVTDILGENNCTLEDQSVFLLRHGLALRGTQALETAPDAATKTNIESAIHRLIHPHEMGKLFKVLQWQA